MREIAGYLFNKFGYILRSGAADGADAAFESGVPSAAHTEIYLPWRGFNNHPSPLFTVDEEATKLAENYHPAWDSLSPITRLLMIRNGYQVLGKNLNDPVEFIVCWTPGGKIKGGTGQALRIAKAFNIPVFNMAKQKDMDHIRECMLTAQIFA